MRIVIQPTAYRTESGIEAGWAAQVLEYDLAAFARTMPALKAEFARVINTHMAACKDLGKDPFSCLGPAPAEYEEMFKNGTPIEFEIPTFEYVNLREIVQSSKMEAMAA